MNARKIIKEYLPPPPTLELLPAGSFRIALVGQDGLHSDGQWTAMQMRDKCTVQAF